MDIEVMTKIYPLLLSNGKYMLYRRKEIKYAIEVLPIVTEQYDTLEEAQNRADELNILDELGGRNGKIVI